jgi:4-amino-4-deoxy-L-arabinose transferase-like glycosyltransferase
MERLKSYLERHWRWLLWLAFPIISLGMHFHLLHLPLQGIHAWRQTETASTVDLFATEDMNILNPRVYVLDWDQGIKRMEFPIMQWVMAVGFKVFGPHVAVIRLLSWLIAWMTMLAFFRLADLLFRNKLVALAAAWCWMFSPEIFYYAINPFQTTSP